MIATIVPGIAGSRRRNFTTCPHNDRNKRLAPRLLWRPHMRRTAFLLVVLFAATAHAQIEDEPAPRAPRPASGALPDASFHAVRGRVVWLRTTAGAELTGQLLSDDGPTLTLAAQPSNDVVTLAKSDIAALRLAEVAPPIVAPPPVATAVAVEPPPRERHFALGLGIAPAFELDVDAGLFYGFANVSLVLPMASDGNLFAMAVGGGVSFHVSRTSNWRFDVFAALTPVKLDSEWDLGIGIGIGMHYTFRSGFTLGFKAPILGYAPRVDGGASQSSRSSGESVAVYYLSGAMGLPILSLGYRF
jgi:hypothetical protein